MPDHSILYSALLERLSGMRPFSCLSTHQLEYALNAARVEAAPAGRLLIGEGRGDSDYLLLLEGELEVSRHIRHADYEIERMVGRLLPGDGAGEMALLQGTPRQASVKALCASRYMRFDGERMEELLAWSQCFSHELNGQAVIRERMNLVHQIGPFRNLPLENVQRAFGLLQPQYVVRDSVVVQQGEVGDVYYLIENGLAEVWRTDPISEETARVATLGPGDAFGEEALLAGGFRNATVKMATHGKLLTLGKADFEALIKPALIEEIGAAQAQELTQQDNVRWIDCRYDVEYEETHIPDAMHMPLDVLRERSATLNHKQTYIVYCQSGRRSACAAYLLRERGFSAYTLSGGLRDWPFAIENGSA